MSKKQTTSRTLVEAKDYILSSIKGWEVDEQTADKIISLAGFVERWNSADGGPEKRRKALQVNINQLENMIKRNKKSKFSCESLEKELEFYKSELVRFNTEFPEKAKKVAA